MAFHHIATDLGGMAGRLAHRYAEPLLDRMQVIGWPHYNAKGWTRMVTVLLDGSIVLSDNGQLQEQGFMRTRRPARASVPEWISLLVCR